MNAFGGKISQIRGGEGQSYFYWRVCDVARSPINDEGRKESNRQSTGYQPRQLQHGESRSGPAPGNHQGNSKLQSKQSAGIVYQALSFKNVDDAARQAQTFRDCRGRDGIGGRHHRSKDRAQPIVETWNKPVGAHRNPEHGKSNQSKGQHQNADDIVVKVSPRSIETTDIEQGRENNEEDNVRIQCDLGQTREQAKNHAAHKEDDGIGNFETLRKRSEPSDQEHKKEKNELEVVNTNGLHGALSRNRLNRRQKKTADSSIAYWSNLRFLFNVERIRQTVAAAKLAA